MKIAIAGGCFTTQHNIPPESLCHQILKNILEAKGISVEIKTIRYERISKCTEKIIELKNSFSFDLLIFHLRTEPVMRLSKLYYKYKNQEGQKKCSFNLPHLNVLYPEKFDLLSRRSFQTRQTQSPESRIHHFLRETNYFMGSLIGNKKYAIRMMEKAIVQIQKFCQENNADFLLLGPVSRPFSKFEDQLSAEMSSRFETLARKKSIPYLALLKKTTNDHQPMFFDNGIHVSQAGHYEIASRIGEKLNKKIQKMMMSMQGKS